MGVSIFSFSMICLRYSFSLFLWYVCLSVNQFLINLFFACFVLGRRVAELTLYILVCKVRVSWFSLCYLQVVLLGRTETSLLQTFAVRVKNKNLCKYMKSIANFRLKTQGDYYRTGLSNQKSELTWSRSRLLMICSQLSRLQVNLKASHECITFFFVLLGFKRVFLTR